MADRPEYECEAGHWFSTRPGYKIGQCPACVLGKPCTAPIKRVGKGSRAANMRAA